MPAAGQGRGRGERQVREHENGIERKKKKEATGPDLLLLHSDVRRVERDIAHCRVCRLMPWQQRLLLQPGHGIWRDDDVALMHRFRRPGGMDYTHPVRHLCMHMYWPPGNTWGERCGLVGEQVPVLTNFVSMRGSRSVWIAETATRPETEEAPAAPQHAPNPLHPHLLLRIPLVKDTYTLLFFFLFFFPSTASSCGVGNIIVCAIGFGWSDGPGTKPVHAVTSARGYMYFFFPPSPSPRYRR